VVPRVRSHRAIVCVPLVELKSAGMVDPAMVTIRKFA
jgi:hypothetical protein